MGEHGEIVTVGLSLGRSKMQQSVEWIYIVSPTTMRDSIGSDTWDGGVVGDSGDDREFG